MDIEALISRRIRDRRKARGLSLEALSERSGVSRSMASLIERGEASPTAAILNKLADALGLSLAALLADEVTETPCSPLVRQQDQSEWVDPASGYRRRHLSPPGIETSAELVEIHFPPNESVIFETLVSTGETRQQIWLLEGRMTITNDGSTWSLQPGDCLAMTVGTRVVFTNPANRPARYLVAVSTIPRSTRKPR